MKKEQSMLVGIRALKKAVQQALQKYPYSYYCNTSVRDAFFEKSEKAFFAKVLSKMSRVTLETLVYDAFKNSSGYSKTTRTFRNSLGKMRGTAQAQWSKANPTVREQYEAILKEIEQKELEIIIGAVNDAQVSAYLKKVLVKIETIKAIK